MQRSAAMLSVLLTLALLAAPVPSDAQQPGKVYRIGLLFGGTPPAPANATPQGCPIQGSPKGTWGQFVEGLREHGYLPGQNLLLVCRYAEGSPSSWT